MDVDGVCVSLDAPRSQRRAQNQDSDAMRIMIQDAVLAAIKPLLAKVHSLHIADPSCVARPAARGDSEAIGARMPAKKRTQRSIAAREPAPDPGELARR